MSNNVNLAIIAHLNRDELRALSEDDFRLAVREYAQRRGWKVYSPFRSAYKNAAGKWRGVADEGFQDMVFGRVKPTPDLFAIECKRQAGGVVAPAQREWQAIWLANGMDSYICRPIDAAMIMDRLK